MADFKGTVKTFWKWVWECVKHSIMPLITYITCSITLAVVAFSADKEVLWSQGTTVRYLLCAVFALVPLVYQGLLAFFLGSNGYDMLVAGNMKRMTYEGDIKMSSHKEEKEYRWWKGFAVGGFMAVITIIVALVWGINKGNINELLQYDVEGIKEVGIGTCIVFLFGLGWSWAILPFMFVNGSGFALSYFFVVFLAAVPVVVSGVFYIIGAYTRRRKRLAKLDAEEKALAEKEARKQKINYGGLPGTKPKKK